MSKVKIDARSDSGDSNEEGEVERLLSLHSKAEDAAVPSSLTCYSSKEKCIGACTFEDLFQRSSSASREGIYNGTSALWTSQDETTNFPLRPAQWDDISGLDDSDSDDGLSRFDRIAQWAQSSSLQHSRSPSDGRKRKAAVLEAEQPFELRASDVDTIVAPLRKAVCDSFP
ncbi:hypothetical protein K474DRAFT_1681040, partial [Panus rudis PR-1116 ss-1]